MAHVGKSHRTPAKHSLMDNLVGQEIGSAGVNPAIDRLVIFDLTAGDGVANNSGIELIPPAWERSCSPGLIAFHARNTKKPLTAVLFEIAIENYVSLIEQLAENLPRLGYRRNGHAHWTFGNMAELRVFHASGATVDLDTMLINRRTSVLVLNDPNAVSMWAMRPTFPAEIARKTPWFRSISTMGCNVGGLKRRLTDHPEEGLKWMGQIESIADFRPDHHDLFLAAIEGDASQWAYLIETSKRDKWREQLEIAAMRSFGKHGYTLRSAWLRLDPSAFSRIINVLFRTKLLQEELIDDIARAV